MTLVPEAVPEATKRGTARVEELHGLTRRSDFERRLERVLVGHRRHGRPVAVLCLQVHGSLPDGVSSPSDDLLLRRFLDRIIASTRVTDCVTALEAEDPVSDTRAGRVFARFAILLGEIARSDHAELVAAKLVDALSAPMATEVDDVQLECQVEVGTCAIPVADGEGSCDDGSQARPVDLLRGAMDALAASISSGGGRVSTFSSSMRREIDEECVLEQQVGQALRRGELRLRYQPILRVADLSTVGVEALVRWQHPTRGLLGPNEFLGSMARAGLGTAMGDWVLRQAMADARWWLLAAPGRRLAVNLGAQQLERPELVDEIDELLATSGVEPRQLDLEVSEQLLLRHRADRLVQRLDHLQDLGVGISFDDYGTGFSSIEQLRRFRGQRLKIDMAFVARLDSHDELAATGHPGVSERERERLAHQSLDVVRGMLELGRGLGLNVVAEGVETETQMHRLVALGCDEAQGHLFAAPENWAKFAAR